MKKAIIICGFPGVGKTTIATNRSNILDAESSCFSWKVNPESPEMRTRNTSFPQNYISFIEGAMSEYDMILTSSHKVVRDGLKERGIKYIIVAPKRDLKNEYLVRYLKRGSDIDFIELLNEKWDEFLTEIENDGAPVILLDTCEVLADVICLQ